MSDRYSPRITPWAVDESAFPAQGTLADQLRFLLSYAILAPSGHNTQPWRFRIDPARQQVLAYADYTRRLAVVDPDDRELVMSVAAALVNLRVAAAHFGLRCEVTPAGQAGSGPAGPSGQEPVGYDLLAVAEIRPGEPDAGLAGLFPAINRRRTNRASYEPRALSDEHRAILASLAPRGLCLVEDPALAGRLAELVAEGDRRQMGDPAFRSELASWVRPDSEGEGEDSAADGFGLPDLMTWGGAWFIRTLNLGAFAARRDAGRAHNAAALAVISGPDTQPGLLEAGDLLERLLLTLVGLGLECSYLNQPIEVAALRGQVQTALGLELPPQILLRIGYAPPLVRAMPRRRVKDVLLP